MTRPPEGKDYKILDDWDDASIESKVEDDHLEFIDIEDSKELKEN